jgi:hypothetical protein
MVGLHLGDQKICPKINNEAMSKSTLIILHLHQCLEKLYSDKYKMIRNLFLRIMASIYEYDAFFVQHPNCTGKFYFFIFFQKCIATFQELAYGIRADFVNEYYKLGESTIMECLKRFA